MVVEGLSFEGCPAVLEFLTCLIFPLDQLYQHPEIVVYPNRWLTLKVKSPETFQDLGVCVVQQCAKIQKQVSTAVSYDRTIKAIKVKVPESDEEFLLHPATMRRNDRSAQSVDEWTHEQKLKYGDIPEKTFNLRKSSPWQTML